MIDVTGLPTTFGSEAFANNIATGDDAIVAAMRAAGGLPMGKTNTPEWSAAWQHPQPRQRRDREPL